MERPMPDDLMLSILRKIQADIAKNTLQLTDLTDAMRRLEGDIGALRGRESADGRYWCAAQS
jgi:hypothetical protein